MELDLLLGTLCTLWIDPDDGYVYSVQKEITFTDDAVIISTIKTPRPIKKIGIRPPVIEKVNVTMTKQEYFKRKLAGEIK